MATTAETLATAVQWHKAGNLAAAESSYREILAREPSCPDARHMLGVVAHQRGDNDRAALLIREAILIRPNSAPYHCNLGVVLKAQGKLDQAVGSYRNALQLAPNYAEAHCNLGTALRNQGKLSESEASLQAALRIKPKYAEALSNLGATLRKQQKTLQAIQACRKALVLKPHSVDAQVNLANSLRDHGDLNEAATVLRRAIQENPGVAESHTNLGNVLQDMGQVDEALDCYRTALQLRPDYAQARTNLGAALRHKGEWDSAIEHTRHALQIDPDAADAHWNLALLLLSRGDFAHGWTEYEWRWRLCSVKPRRFPKPAWEGQSLFGKKLLVHTEQGLGDSIQFLRYLPHVRPQCEQLIFQCPPALHPLLQHLPVRDVIGPGDSPPDFDVHCPLLSLPRLFKTRRDTIPAAVPYLRADPVRVSSWRQRLGVRRGLRVGICWQGSPTFAGDRFRSIPLRHFAGLAKISEVEFVSMQKEHGLEQLRRGDFPADLLDVSDGLTDFGETAAAMANLDLVISSDTSVAHLAGALGMPVWLAVPYAPDWRWLRGREDSPWYPSMRLFRQTEFGDWKGVFERITALLAAKCRTHGTLSAQHA